MASSFDVFMSFNELDTGHSFAGHLYKALLDEGLRVFMEEDALSKGNKIAPEIVCAIDKSKIAIVVFSENYVSSTFCLDVLVEILQRNSLVVLPIFYLVNPSLLRHLIGPFGEAMAKHEERFKNDQERLRIWKSALRQASNFSGWSFEDGYEHNFIMQIVKSISARFSPVPLHVAYHPVGLESRIQEVCSLLDFGLGGVHMVGIHGMGGLGKTTLALAIYNLIAHMFDGSCFLDGVRENSIKHGLVHLQERLLSDVIGEKDSRIATVNEGMSIIKNRLRARKILLILDDVDKLEQLDALVGGCNWFGDGSRIIITTRDRHLLAFHGVERNYELGALNDVDALRLFSWFAFRDSQVPTDYMDMSRQVLVYASGLPLVLEVIGSYLFGRSINEWKSALPRFERASHKEIESILRISFDALDAMGQSVFLDIACCFNGYQLTEIQDILCAHYGYSVEHCTTDLVEKSLVSISSDGKVILLPVVEQMGKDIVLQESPREPGRRSRLWLYEDIIQVLQNNTGTSTIEIIHLAFPLSEEEIVWNVKAFVKMENLRTLIIKNGCFLKGPEHLPSSLRVLEWQGYPSKHLPSDFHPEKLVILKIVNLQNTTSARQAKLIMTLKWLLEAEMTWRLVGFVSSVVGLSCHAVSPSFNRLIRGWNIFKCSLYGLLSLTICATVLFSSRSPLLEQHFKLRAYLGFAVLMMISVYSFFYDKAVNGKPEILSLVSNAAFALMSLSLSRLMKFGFEMGIFSFFLGCLTIQLVTIDLRLILVAIIFGFPLYIMHSSSDSRSRFAVGNQPIIPP